MIDGQVLIRMLSSCPAMSLSSVLTALHFRSPVRRPVDAGILHHVEGSKLALFLVPVRARGRVMSKPGDAGFITGFRDYAFCTQGSPGWLFWIYLLILIAVVSFPAYQQHRSNLVLNEPHGKIFERLFQVGIPKAALYLAGIQYIHARRYSWI